MSRKKLVAVFLVKHKGQFIDICFFFFTCMKISEFYIFFLQTIVSNSVLFLCGSDYPNMQYYLSYMFYLLNNFVPYNCLY